MFDTTPALRCASRSLPLDRPQVMGILNLTPDSFSDGGIHADAEAALLHARTMVEQGATVIDIGGESTRPGATPVPVEVEIERICPLIERLAAEVDVVLSVDTCKPAVMAAAIAAGVHMVNDIQALRQPGALDVVAASDVAVVLMHAVGGPFDAGMPQHYDDVTAEVARFLAERVFACELAGIERRRLLLDPGYGFAKDNAQNFELLARQRRLLDLGLPLLAGLSRKRCIGEATGRQQPAERDAGSLAAHLLAVQNGAMLVRTHDVAATVDALGVLSRVAQVPAARSVPKSAALSWPDDL
jgi:dihydropteroate synthase